MKRAERIAHIACIIYHSGEMTASESRKAAEKIDAKLFPPTYKTIENKVFWTSGIGLTVENTVTWKDGVYFVSTHVLDDTRSRQIYSRECKNISTLVFSTRLPSDNDAAREIFNKLLYLPENPTTSVVVED